jgi:hypothetical protein
MDGSGTSGTSYISTASCDPVKWSSGKQGSSSDQDDAEEEKEFLKVASWLNG